MAASKKKKSTAKKVVKKSAPKKAKAAKAKVKAKPKAKSMAKVPAKPVASKATKSKSAPASAAKAKPAAGAKSRIDVRWEDFFTPLDDRMIVTVMGTSDRTPGGIYIPATAENASGHKQGEVLTVGRGHRDKKGRVRPMDVQVGDTVVFASYSGSKMNIQGAEVVILREADVLGILND